jgi:hypothetical protein
MSCRVGLLRLHRSGLIELPAPTGGNGNGRPLKHAPKAWPEEVPLDGDVSPNRRKFRRQQVARNDQLG